ncbi:MAG TPA: HAD family phosphatase [Acidimicrobiales bacterium]|nr:HAD family phosphatase [Acidimicrobiales bacterium]
MARPGNSQSDFHSGTERPRAVFFDLGGVLLDWDPRNLYRKLFGDDTEAMEIFLTEVCSPAWHLQQDKGMSVAAACAGLKVQFPLHTELIEAWELRSDEMISGVIEGSAEMLAELKAAGVPCYALSNMERETWGRRLGIYPFLHWFDGYFISALEGVLKPDPRYFELALERFGLEPREVFFIDDREENVASARSLGIMAAQFSGAQAVRAGLSACGLLPSGP